MITIIVVKEIGSNLVHTPPQML